MLRYGQVTASNKINIKKMSHSHVKYLVYTDKQTSRMHNNIVQKKKEREREVRIWLHTEAQWH